MTNKHIEEAKKTFEANLLDGDKVNDCGGAILDAKDVWEVLEEYIIPEVAREVREELLKRIDENLPEEKSGLDLDRIANEVPRKNGMIKESDLLIFFEKSVIEAKKAGYNEAILEIKSTIKSIRDDG
jgi:hypothetical protein